jgi:hypothetical protein
MVTFGEATVSLGDLIAVVALATSIFGLIVPWWQAGQARLEIRFERWFDDREEVRRYRAVVVNRGGGTAMDARMGLPIDDKSVDDATLDLDVIYPGQELYFELMRESSFRPLTDGLLRWRDGRLQRPRSRQFLVTVKDLV